MLTGETTLVGSEVERDPASFAPPQFGICALPSLVAERYERAGR
jgi:hypothetical protein